MSKYYLPFYGRILLTFPSKLESLPCHIYVMTEWPVREDPPCCSASWWTGIIKFSRAGTKAAHYITSNIKYESGKWGNVAWGWVFSVSTLSFLVKCWQVREWEHEHLRHLHSARDPNWNCSNFPPSIELNKSLIFSSSSSSPAAHSGIPDS